MPVTADVEGLGKLEFPDGTAPEVVQSTVKRLVAGGGKDPLRDAIDKRKQSFGITDQLVDSLPFGKDAAALAHARPISRALGMPVEGTFGEKYNEGKEIENRASEDYAKEHPWASAGAKALGFATVGAPGKIAAAAPAGLKALSVQGAKTGAVLGTAEGAGDTEGDTSDTAGTIFNRVRNGLIGGGVGAAGGATLPWLMAGAGRLVKPLIAPFTKSGQEQIAGHAINQAVEGRPIQPAPAPLPGMQPTAGQATNDPGLLWMEHSLQATTPAGMANAATARTANNQAVRGAVNTLGNTGANVADAGQVARGAVQDKLAGLQDARKIMSGPLYKEAEQDAKGTDTWYHGTRASFDKFNTPEAYLTTSKPEAMKYAEGVHLGGNGNEKPFIKEFGAKPGKTIKVDSALTDAMENGGDLITTLNKEIKQARDNGARYVEYNHPSAAGDEDHLVRIALHPNEDLHSPIDVKPVMAGLDHAFEQAKDHEAVSLLKRITGTFMNRQGELDQTPEGLINTSKALGRIAADYKLDPYARSMAKGAQIHLDDILEQQVPTYKAARSMFRAGSGAINEMEEGATGKVLAKERSGTPKVPDSAVIDKFITTGAGAPEKLMKFIAATDRTPTGAAAREAARDAWTTKFMDTIESHIAEDAAGGKIVHNAKIGKFLDDYDHVVKSPLLTDAQRATVQSIKDAAQMTSRDMPRKGSDTAANLAGDKFIDALLGKWGARSISAITGTAGGLAGHVVGLPLGALGAAGAASAAVASGAVIGNKIAAKLYSAPRDKVVALLNDAMRDPAMAQALQTRATAWKFIPSATMTRMGAILSGATAGSEAPKIPGAPNGR